MRARTAGLLGVSLLVLGGCKGAPPPPPPPTAAKRFETPTPPPRAAGPTEAERSAEYTREHPWGDYTGTTRLSGKLVWGEGEGSADEVASRALVLKGVKGTPSFGLYYRLRANNQGEFVFDRIKGGEFKLSDDISGSGFHWRLRVEIKDGDDIRIDLTPANSVKVRDDFPRDGN